VPYRDNTPQEKLLKKVIEENGLLYEYQVRMGQYTIDFFLPELDVIIEADGVFGHLNKRDRKRDADLGDMGYSLVWHLKEQTLSGLRDEFTSFMEEHHAGNRTDTNNQPS
jgi:very-short-patch-repair endonuclease